MRARSWGYAFPELVIDCPRFASRQQTPGDVFALHPLHPLTLRLIEGVLTQIASVFPSEFLHVGGDEVMTECWLEDPVLVR
jgi:hexosaminidase